MKTSKSPLDQRRILVLDDELPIRKALAQRLEEEGATCETVDRIVAARQKLQDHSFDLLIFDHRLPDGTGLGLLEEIKKADPTQPIVMMTAYSSTEDAVRAMKAGAADYVMKPFDLDEMVVVAERTLEHQALRQEVARLRRTAHGDASLQNLVGSSASMQSLRDLIERVAQSGARTILIHGESGTGKDLVARAIHQASPEADRPFLNITCTALPEGLLESELFGHEKGAFTDAKSAKKGLFEEADGGTIFLDEIGDMPLSLQGKLLRFLESKTFRRVGGVREIQVDVRVVAATNRVLRETIEEGRFRSDLFYRLNVIPIEVEPLRNNPEDIPQLVEYFVDRFSQELRKPAAKFTPEAMTRMCQYPWPGNVRELRNCIERAVLLSREGTLGLNDLPKEVRGPEAAGGGRDAAAGFLLPEGGVVLDDMVKDLLDQALERCRGNKSRAATLLGIHRDQVRYWVKKYGLTRWIRTRAKSMSSSSSSAEE